MNSADLVEIHAELLALYGEDLEQLLVDLTLAVRDTGTSPPAVASYDGSRDVSLVSIRPLN